MGRQYVVISHLHYDARTVSMEAMSRPLAKPGGGGNAVVWRAGREFVRPEDPVEVDLEPAWPGAPLPFHVHIVWYDEYAERFDTYLDVPSPERRAGRRTRADLRSPIPPGFAARAGQLATRAARTPNPVSPRQYTESVPEADPNKVFVVVGRNTSASDAMFAFLRALGLRPIEWGEAVRQTGSGSPYIGQVIDVGFEMAQAVVVLMTPDDVAHLRRDYARDDDDPELKPAGQARPNVLFEAGMAFGRHPDRTILVELGPLRPFTDVGGRHTVRLDNEAHNRNELANRLETAGCNVSRSGSDWLRAGDFTPPKAPSDPLPTGRRLPSNAGKKRSHLDARYLGRGAGSDKVQVTNIGSEDVYDLKSQNTQEFRGHLESLRAARLPAGKTATLSALKASGHPDSWELIVKGRNESGDEFTESLYLDLNG